jgi:CRISPR-associated exonuclease Cas4
MMNNYSEDNLLLLSGIQHIAFCERQWALIHIEQAWSENVRTVEGKQLHEHTDDAFFDESRSGIRTVRAMPLVSYELGLRGVADVVEFHREEPALEHLTVRIKNHGGWWRPVPVEYKRGRPKPDDRDAVQLCAQAIALEEMLNITVEYGMLYYGQTRHRETVLMDSELRRHTFSLAERMHSLFSEGRTPKALKGKHCSQCSLVELCKPDLTLRHRSVKDYIDKMCGMEVNGN